MGHSLSADKRERQNIKRRRLNRGNMIALRKAVKGVLAAASAGNADPKALLAKAYAALDRAARKHAIPKKRANRKKARIALALNRAQKSAPAQPAAT
ncbi:MAG: 30S ribosomal protein S20 [Planctomycetota bacterium]|nr:30S ribosomal protein S20 [Planctomycetota bacterium]